ncbi:TTC7B protein, partial [Atractosteus spatula]|nr:TTC7B protein [Atractosteus spatula]
MAAKKSGSRLETEIERCRSEGQWDRIPELVRQLSAKLISNAGDPGGTRPHCWGRTLTGGVVCLADDLGELLLGEAKLQQYLKENPIKQGYSPRGARPQLVEVRKHLTAALDRGNLKSEYMQEAHLLMAKLSYVEGDYREATGIYSRVGLDEVQLVGIPMYRLSMIAEAYATKGLCLEKVPVASPVSNRNTDQDQEIITCYEKSGDIALLYLQEMEKALSTGLHNRSPKPGPVSQEQELGYFLETGLQRAHVIHFKNGNLTRGVGRFREILRAIETRTTQNLRMTIARQLAEILLRGMCEQSYWSPLEDPPHPSPLDDPLRQASRAKDYALSRRPRVYSGESIFCPQENTEEALLLLLISESMANRDAVLSRIPEHNNDRIISLQSASVVYDLLTIALGRRGQYEMLSECLERAMKFAFEEFHLWYQFALSLMAAGKSARAVRVLKECIRLKPDDPTIPLLAVKLCIGTLHWLEEGERFAKMVVDMGEKASEFRAKGYLAIGLVYSLKASDASLRGMQEEYQKKALGAFQRAQSLSPTDHVAVFYLALQLAVSRQIPEALGYVRQALQLQGDDAHSLHLLALLLSAQKHYHDALNIIEMALSEYPENFILLFTKVKLETVCRGPDEALLTCKHMLQIWKSCYNLTNPSDSGRGSSLLDRAIADRRQLNTMTLPDFSDPETGRRPAGPRQLPQLRLLRVLPFPTWTSDSSSVSGSEPSLHFFVSSHHCPPSKPEPPPKPGGHAFCDHALGRRLSSAWFSSNMFPVNLQKRNASHSVEGNPPDAYFHGFYSIFSVCSVHATSVAASRVEQALSEVASSLQSSAPKQGPLHPWMTLAQIWLHAAEVYIGMGKPTEATACTQEAASLFPMSHNVLFMKGQVAELRGNMDEAKRWYEEALSISPTHVKTMQRLTSDRTFKKLRQDDVPPGMTQSQREAFPDARSRQGVGDFTGLSAPWPRRARREVENVSGAALEGLLGGRRLPASALWSGGGVGTLAERGCDWPQARAVLGLSAAARNRALGRGGVELTGGLILHQLGRYSLAEKVLRDAVQVNSTAHDVWNSLGEVLQAQGNDDAATECFLTALELEASSPILPFTIIPRTL